MKLNRKLASVFPPLRKLYKRLDQRNEEILRLQTQIWDLAREKESIHERLCDIDTKYLLKSLRNPTPVPKAGQEARIYCVEAISHCDLRCSMCPNGYLNLFERKPGKMSLSLFEKIVDKIKSESPEAVVIPYGYCEPTLHPQLPEMLSAIKRRGLYAACSFNFNRIRRLDDILASGVDRLEISLSGFSQAAYEKAHIRGSIENVKTNLLKLRQAMDRLGLSPCVSLTYHMYRYNLGDDFEQAKKFAEDLGFYFAPAWARCICVELGLMYLRQLGLNRYTPPPGQKSYLADFPPLPQSFMNNMDELLHVPQDYLEGSWAKRFPLNCNLNRVHVYIRWTGQVSLCSCSFDDHLVLEGDFFTNTAEQIASARAAHPICLECRANNFIYYMQYVGMDDINQKAAERLKGVNLAGRAF